MGSTGAVHIDGVGVGEVNSPVIVVQYADHYQSVTARQRNFSVGVLVGEHRAARCRSRLAAHGLCNDRDKLIRFCGGTRITPVRGLSISAIKKKATETRKGKTVKRKRSRRRDP